MPLDNKTTAEISSLHIVSTADVNSETVESTATLNPIGVTSSPKMNPIHPSTGESSGDHAALEHLDYEHSGHKGFASDKDLQVAISIEAPLGAISEDDLAKLKKNFTAVVELNNRFLTLSSRNGNNWTYTSNPDTNGTFYVMTINMNNGTYTSTALNPAQSNLNTHIQNTDVHIQAGERTNWNKKVSAEVIVDEEKLKLF